MHLDISRKEIMTKKELINKIALETEVSKKEVNLIVKKVFELISKNLLDKKEVLISDFGKFTILQKVSRKGVNPITRQKMVIPASKTVKFKPSKQLKELLIKE
ncbi:HU family DNA-binding protein [Mycoplasma capricolum subsp. capricolum]|nr:HU family DNA-binding protein [Mycoplasma capricolum]WBX36716.1 HU family DNA-binding protein [Mycoplasma capricolum subsp. capricolum]